jgi:asparagine synthase (glutamine-hydrolysing)
MCGIAAVIRFDGQAVETSVIERMAASLVHRGPDEGRVVVTGSVGLGFRRLSILDLSNAASQPMTSDDGGIVLLFNGEIFNYIELREELSGRGHRFRSTGDTEVLLRAYEEWGRECLPRLNGMWAFLIYDRRRRTLFGARDRFGVKPLYRYRRGSQLLVASEIKAIRASGAYTVDVDWERAANFLHHGRLDDGPGTFYAEISQVPAGTAFEVDAEGQNSDWRYWSLDDLREQEIGDPVERFQDLFEDSVRLRLRSDVPVGVSLSGGLDSSSIACAAGRLIRQVDAGARKTLFAFSYMAPEYDETRYIDEILKEADARLHRLETTPHLLWERLPEVLWYQDEPVHSLTAVVGYELMRLSSSCGVRVVLNGQGADETIGGYFSYFKDYWRELLWAGRPGKVWDEIQQYSATHSGSASKLLLGVVEHMSRRQLRRFPAYRQLAASWRRQKLQQDPWFVPELVNRMSPGYAAGTRGLNAALKHSVAISPLPLYLRVEDRNSMAHSVEARLPFLDYRLVSLLFRLRSQWKMRGGVNKYLLREAMRGRIPESVRTRKDKMGFPTPVRKWLAGELYEPIRELLESREARERGVYNTGAVIQDLEAHRRGGTDISDRLLGVAQFELWARMIKEPVVTPGA